MARQPSKILSAAELKQHSKDLGTALKNHKAGFKSIEANHAGEKKTFDKAVKDAGAVLAAAQKVHDKAVKDATKVFEAQVKAFDKAKAAADKGEEKINGQLAALQPAVTA